MTTNQKQNKKRNNHEKMYEIRNKAYAVGSINNINSTFYLLYNMVALSYFGQFYLQQSNKSECVCVWFVKWTFSRWKSKSQKSRETMWRSERQAEMKTDRWKKKTAKPMLEMSKNFWCLIPVVETFRFYLCCWTASA